MLMGEYHYTIDEKGRVTIPSKFRDELKEKFIVTRGLDKCLFVYSMEEWNNIINKYRELPNTKDARNFMRFFLSAAFVCECDKQGRIKISDPLITYANLNHDCVIIGVNERLEIWSKEAWESFMNDNFDGLSDIADNLFRSNI
ncbi:MAG: division/cell wall cluster transcriptional repressor MraZ [Bacilli bacterium]|nr:division/cell wall cluster transcriptional repressor MraZ [Bacilli bacterium]